MLSLAPAKATIFSTLPETFVASLPGSGTSFHDVVVNCDMLETDIPVTPDENPFGSILKAIVWDNGENVTTPGTLGSWLYVEDPLGNNTILGLGAGFGQPDVVIINDVTPGPNGMPDYIIGVVGILDNGLGADIYLKTFDVFGVGTPGFNVMLRQTQNVTTGSGTPPVWRGMGLVDGLPHIDAWTDPATMIGGFNGMREFAISWTQDYQYGPIFNPNPPYNIIGYTCTAPQKLYYNTGDLNNIATVSGGSFVAYCKNNTDITCYTDMNTTDKHIAIVFNRLASGNCAGAAALHVFDYDISSGGPALPTVLSNDDGVLQRIESMNQYNPGQIKWQVAAAMPNIGSGFQILSFDDLSNVNHVSINYNAMDNKGPAVAAGVSPQLSANIGNAQYTLGYRPMDYNCFEHFDIYSRGIDAVTGVMSSDDYQVNSNATPICYPWDLNKSYAVSNCSNSGLDILSAWFNGNNIVYKISPNNNPMVYKPGNTTGVAQVNAFPRLTLTPNPATSTLNIEHATTGYQITDVTGKTLLQGSKPTQQIDISSLAKGIYFFRSGAETVKFTKH